MLGAGSEPLRRISLPLPPLRESQPWSRVNPNRAVLSRNFGLIHGIRNRFGKFGNLHMVKIFSESNFRARVRHDKIDGRMMQMTSHVEIYTWHSVTHFLKDHLLELPRKNDSWCSCRMCMDLHHCRVISLPITTLRRRVWLCLIGLGYKIIRRMYPVHRAYGF